MSYTIIEACNGCGACVKICPVKAIAGEKKQMHVISAALCIECGVCGKVCPQSAVKDATGKVCVMVKKSLWEKPEFDKKKCMSCNICIDTCPVACISLAEPGDKKDPHGYPYLENEKACISCSFCVKDCLVDAITMAAPAKE